MLESNLEPEWLKQADRLADRFAKILDQSRYQYMDSLPMFPQPDRDRAGFDTALLVQVPTPKLTIAMMLEVAEIINNLPNLITLKDRPTDLRNFHTPDMSYAVLLYVGTRNLHARGGTYLEGVNLAIQDSDILIDYLPLPGSQYGGAGVVPCLRRCRWSGRFIFDYGNKFYDNQQYGLWVREELNLAA